MIKIGDDPLGNAAMEFHDSIVAAAKTDGAILTIVLSPAYIHRSTGTPGVDKGTGWRQEVIVALRDCALPFDFPMLPIALVDGQLITSERINDGMVPLPLYHAGQVCVELRFECGGCVRLSASEIRADLAGEPVYLEAFRGSGPSGEKATS